MSVSLDCRVSGSDGADFIAGDRDGGIRNRVKKQHENGNAHSHAADIRKLNA
jgi:hypothetical protein